METVCPSCMGGALNIFELRVFSLGVKAHLEHQCCAQTNRCFSPFSILVNTNKSQFVSESKSWFGTSYIDLRLQLQQIHRPALAAGLFLSTPLPHLEREQTGHFCSLCYNLCLVTWMCNVIQVSVEPFIMDVKLGKIKQQTIFCFGKCCDSLITTKKSKWSLHIFTASRKACLCSQPSEQLHCSLPLICSCWSQEWVSDCLPVFKNIVTRGGIRDLLLSAEFYLCFTNFRSAYVSS